MYMSVKKYRKRANNQPFSHIVTYPFSFYRFSHIRTREPLYYHENSHRVSVIIQVVTVFVSYPTYFNNIFRQANTPFSQNRQYPTPFDLSVLYYHGNPWLLRESILLPDSTIFAPIAILSAASKNKKNGAHHPPWWTPPNLKIPWF